jgi:hypothetical protein
MRQQPDLVLFAGDYVQLGPRPQRAALRDALADAMRAADVHAPLGALAVRGNVDGDDWSVLFDGLPVTAVESTQAVDVGPLTVTCLSVADSYDTTLRVERPAGEKFHLVLGHCPDFALSPAVDADLLVAGHTHGGQVRLPFVGALWTHSRVPRQWCAGVTELSGGRKLLVSRGVGMERGDAPRLRFLCRPELVVIELAPPLLQ